jgi:hypothetical protein
VLFSVETLIAKQLVYKLRNSQSELTYKPMKNNRQIVYCFTQFRLLFRAKTNFKLINLLRIFQHFANIVDTISVIHIRKKYLFADKNFVTYKDLSEILT